jgi:GT2 family glycosyltransferase
MGGERRSLLLAQSFSRESGRLVGGGVRVDWRRLHFATATSPEEVDCLSTRGLFLTVGDFMALGGFYPKLLPHYLSDYEFTLRAARCGMRLRIDDSLKLLVDEKTTGYHQFSGETFRVFLRKYFARNSDANPFAWTMFIALACPWPWKVTGWLRVWYGTTVKVLKALAA